MYFTLKLKKTFIFWEKKPFGEYLGPICLDHGTHVTFNNCYEKL